jgi:hypothetical protein
MRSSEPPALATWWLEHLRFGARNDFLLGDLVEEYGQGRSRAWYWRQVLVALLVNFGRELCARPLLAARTVATVWSVWYLYGFVFSSSLHRLLIPLPPAIGFMWLIGSCTGWAISGWIVARLHREHKTTMALVFAVSVLLWKLPWLYTLLVDTLSNARYRPYLLNEFLDLILTFVSISLGGLWCARSETDASARIKDVTSVQVHARSKD